MCSQNKQNSGREVVGQVSCPVWGGEEPSVRPSKGRTSEKPWLKVGIPGDVSRVLV